MRQERFDRVFTKHDRVNMETRGCGLRLGDVCKDMNMPGSHCVKTEWTEGPERVYIRLCVKRVRRIAADSSC